MVRFKSIIALVLAAAMSSSSVYIPERVLNKYSAVYDRKTVIDDGCDEYDGFGTDDVFGVGGTSGADDNSDVMDTASDIDMSGIDFSSCELLVAAEDAAIFTADTEVVSEYNGIYLTSYKNEERTREAYIYYQDKADFVDVNVCFSVQDDKPAEETGGDAAGTGEGDDDKPAEASIDEADDKPVETAIEGVSDKQTDAAGDDTTEQSADAVRDDTVERQSDGSDEENGDALSKLNEMDIDPVPAKTIAVIDTGINADDLVGRVSVIGESAEDDNGHGTKMYEFIKAEYPEARILSVKALGADGKSRVSDVYAALQYAIESGVDIIELSISAYSVSGSEVIEKTINEAVEQGIIVVGAAGNNGKNVKYFIPGNIESAVIVGSCDDNGTRIPSSNYGETVDYFVVSGSTSEAAARMCGIIASNDGRSEAVVFIPAEQTTDDQADMIVYENGEFHVANDPNPDNYNGGASGTKEYVENSGRPGDGEVTYFRYYDKNGNYISGGINTSLYVNGSSKQTNVICIRDARSPGNTGYQFEVNKKAISDTTFRRLAYYAITMLNYNDAHYLLCYYAYRYGSDISGINLSDGNSTAGSKGSTMINVTGFSGTYNQFIAKYKAVNIPDSIEFELFYLGYDPTGMTYHSSTYFQDFLAWKVTEKKDYYIAIKKVDGRGYALNGVSFNVSYKDNDSGTTVNIPGGYFDNKYSGIWTGFRIDTRDTYRKSYRSTDNEGIGVFYLGKFVKAPTDITVTENWHGRTDAGSDWEGGKAELVTQKKSPTQVRKTEDVYSKEYAEKSLEGRTKTLAAYNTEEDAIGHAASFTYTNWHYAYASMQKQADTVLYSKDNTEYTFDGITYGLYGDSACSELIATVRLTSVPDRTKGIIAKPSDITINKTAATNGSKPYRVTIDGIHGIGGLMYGDYWWKEISAADSGYKLNMSAHKITLSESHVKDFYIYTDTDYMEMGRIRVHKNITGNAAEGASPKGAKYLIESTTFDWSSTFTIGENGYSEYKNLVYGTYRIQEIEEPESEPENGSWTMDNTVYEVTLRKGAGKKDVGSSVRVVADDATVLSTDEAVRDVKSYYAAVKKVDGTNEPMDGITFDVYINGTKQARQLVTGRLYNSAGKYASSSLGGTGVGIYYLGKFDTAPTVKIVENWADESYVHNTKSISTSDGTLSIYTSLSGAKSHAAEFEYKNLAYAYATMHKTSSDTECTDGNSNYSLTGIKYGLYKSGDNKQIATVTLTEVTENGVTKGVIKNLSDIRIVDTTTKNGELNQYYRKTVGGKHSIGGLVYNNKYYWKEISVPDSSGYTVDDKKYEFTATDSNVDKPVDTGVTEIPEKGRIRVRKLLTGSVASGISPAGAVYEIKGTGVLSGYSGTFTIAADGYSSYKSLPYGTYKIKEKTVPTAKPVNGEWSVDTNTYTVVLKKGAGTRTISSTVSTEAADATVQSTDTAYVDYYVAVKKVDGNNNPMNGVTFDITVNGTRYEKAVITGKDYNGTAYKNGTNGVGSYYLGRYSSAPTVSVKENWTEKWNKQRFVHDSVSKKPAVYTSLADAKSHAADYTYTNTSYGFATMHKESTGDELSMAGIKYELRRCRSSAGTSVNTLVATVTLNSAGKIDSVTLTDSKCWTENQGGNICIGGLSYGEGSGSNNYYWVETVTNDNYSLDNTKYYITVNKANSTKPGADAAKYPTEYTFTPAGVTAADNPRAYVGIFKKDDAGTNVAATFDIYGTNTRSATDGDEKVGTITTSAATGKASFEVTDIYNSTSKNIDGKYRFFYAVETSVDAEHYNGADRKILTVKTGVLTDADHIQWTNPRRTYLYLTKRSSDAAYSDNNPNYSLKGAEYRLYRSKDEAETALANGNYGTALAVFIVKANGASTVKVGTDTYDRLDVSQWMNRNPDTGVFVKTDFYIIETKAGKNYMRSTKVERVTVTGANVKNNPARADMTDDPVRVAFDIELVKTDMISGNSCLPEGKTLEGARFSVEYYAVDIETVLAEAGGDVAGYLSTHYTSVPEYSSEASVTESADGSFKVDIDNGGKDFPLGFIVIKETKAPEDYLLADSAQYIVDEKSGARTDVTGNTVFVTYGSFGNDQAEWKPKTYYPNNASTLTELVQSTGAKHGICITDEEVDYILKVEDAPIRGDVRLTKLRYSDGSPLDKVEFVIKNTDTGEERTIVTDAFGNATTVNNPDAWFRKTNNENEEYPFAEGYGALPIGHYTITEKRSAANAGYQLLAPESFEVTRDSTEHIIAAIDNRLYNIEMPYITTTAMDKATQSKSLVQGEKSTIIDTIKYYHLRANSKYYLVGTLMVRHPDGTYEAYQKDGAPYKITSSAINTPATWTKSEFEIDGEYVMEFPDVDPAGYEGCSFVVFQKLYYKSVPSDDTEAEQYPEYAGTDEKIFPVLHEDIESEGQTVRPVDIHTNAKDGISMDHISKPEGSVTITDRVNYTGLTVGEKYTVKGVLHVTGYTWKDADGNEIKMHMTGGRSSVGEQDDSGEQDVSEEWMDDILLDEEGQPVTASQTFTAATKDGYIDLKFTVDASLLAGESVVAFETLYYGEKVLAVHADLNDEDQTVHFPNIHTTLYRGGTEEWAENFDKEDITRVTTVDESSKEIMAAENVVVVDRIKYHNLLANRHYIIKGILMDKETGELFIDAAGKTVEVTYEFDTPTAEPVDDIDTHNSAKYICADGTELDMSADHADYLVDGYTEVEFPAFNGTGMDGKILVAYEELYLVRADEEAEEAGQEDVGDDTKILVSEHKDIDDNDQTVRFPKIHTNAEVEETNSKMVPIDGSVTINDTVTYKNLVPGKEYTLSATLVVKNDESGTHKDGDALLDKEGNPITAEISFTPEEADGEVVVPITFEGGIMPEVEIACFETLSNDKGLDIAVHNDIEDKDQTTYVVRLHTTATDSETEDHVGTVSEKAKIIDKVEYTNLIIGEEYTVKGVMIVKETGKPLMIDNKEVTSKITFTAEMTDGFVELEFTFDASALEGKTVVAFEDIYWGAFHVGTHRDIEDESQTVRFPKVRTKAEDSETKDNIGEAGEETTIIDTVSYWNLEIGQKYTVKGKLMLQGTEEEYLVDGKPVTAEKTFVAEETDGTIELEFTFNSTLAAGETIIVFEDLYHNDKRVAGHIDISDESQSEHHPRVKTTAVDSETKDHTGKVGEEVTIIDTVEYKNLLVGKDEDGKTREYTIKGILYVKETGKPLKDANGKTISSEVTFTPEKPNGTIDMLFTFDSTFLEGQTVVVFEDIFYKGIRVGTHTDIDDEEQSVHYPKVKTKAEDATTKDNIGEARTETTIIDTVSYWNLIPGKEYTVKGVLMVQETGKNLLVNGKEVIAEKTFTAEEADGSVELKFMFDSSVLDGAAIVVFEDLYHEGVRVGTHSDITDEGQTVYYPAVHTQVKEPYREAQPVNKVKVVDEMVYHDLSPEKRYLVEGVLIDKTTGKEVRNEELPVVTRISLVPESKDGTLEVPFEFDATDIAGHDVVIFEYIWLVQDENNNDMKQYLVAEHKDIGNTDQTFRVSEHPDTTVKTGDNTNTALPMAVMILSAAALVILIWNRTKKGRK